MTFKNEFGIFTVTQYHKNIYIDQVKCGSIHEARKILERWSKNAVAEDEFKIQKLMENS